MRRSVDVEIQAVLALVLQERQEPLQVEQPPPGHPLQREGIVRQIGQPLRAHSTEGGAHLDPVPRQRGLGRVEAVRADGGRGVGDAEEHVHRAEVLAGGDGDAADLTPSGGDDRSERAGVGVAVPAAEEEHQVDEDEDALGGRAGHRYARRVGAVEGCGASSSIGRHMRAAPRGGPARSRAHEVGHVEDARVQHSRAELPGPAPGIRVRSGSESAPGWGHFHRV